MAGYIAHAIAGMNEFTEQMEFMWSRDGEDGKTFARSPDGRR